MYTASPKPKYTRVADVRARYGGVSDMWIARKQRECGFPAPVFLGGRDRFWIVEQLDDWDREQLTHERPANSPVPPRRAKARAS